jgi:hypothetical protein
MKKTLLILTLLTLTAWRGALYAAVPLIYDNWATTNSSTVVSNIVRDMASTNAAMLTASNANFAHSLSLSNQQYLRSLNNTNVSGEAMARLVDATNAASTVLSGGSAASAISIVDPLNGRTNTAVLASLVVSNSTYGRFGINFSGTEPGVNTYGNGMYYLPNSDGAFTWSRYLGPNFNSIFGTTVNSKMRLGDANFGGLMLNDYGKANPYNNLLFAEVNVSAVGTWGGSIAAATGLPIEPSANAEALDYPPTVLTSWNNNLTDTLAQTNVWEQMRNAATNGLLYAYTNQGIQLWYHMDSNVHWLTNTRQSGELAINSDAFPMGTNFLRYWQTNGWKFALTAYSHPTPSNNIYLNEIGQEVAAGSARSSPATTPSTMANDVRKFYEWGLDMWRGSDFVYDTGYQRYWLLELANAIINPKGTIYANYWKLPYAHNEAEYRPMAFMWLTPWLGGTDPIAYSQANVVNHDFRDFGGGNGGFLGAVSSATTALEAMNLFRSVQTNAVPHLSKGHYGVGISLFADESSVMNARWQLTPSLMQWGLINISTPTNTMLSAFMPNIISQLTNTEFVSLRKDVTDKCFRVVDSGVSNSSVWARRLADNSYLVFVANESNNTANVSFNWSQLGTAIGQSYYVTDVWNKTNVGAYTSSFRTTVPSEELKLLRFSPCVIEEDGWESVTIPLTGGFQRSSPSGGTYFSPAPNYWEQGLHIGTGTASSSRIPVRTWATNVILEFSITASGAGMWTNLIEPFMYSDGGRTYNSGGIANSEHEVYISASGVVSNVSYSVTFPATNSIKAISFSFKAATNTTAWRYAGPSLRRIYR